MTATVPRLLVPLLLAASPALAAPNHAEGDRGFGIDAAVALAVGDFSRGNSFGTGTAIGPGFGALLRYEDAATPVLRLTLRAGFIQHAEGERQGFFGQTITTKFRQIPLLAGFRIDIAKAVFLAGEGGLFNTQMGSSWSHDFGLGFTLGLRLGPAEVGFGLQFLDAAHASDSAMFLLTLGFNFPRF
jgi:hypothetical protein